MNWLSKIDSLLPTFKSAAISHWSIAAMLGIAMVGICLMIAVKIPAMRHLMRIKMRQFRYCHDCKFNDGPTETCSINADRRDTCGVIDKMAGMDFTVTKN